MRRPEQWRKTRRLVWATGLVLSLAMLLGAPPIARAQLLLQPQTQPPTQAEAGTVESVTVQGLLRMTREAFLHALDVKVGDPYDPTKIRGRFKALWRLGLFEDIKIEAEPGDRGGTALIVKVRERPVLSSVSYDDTKAVTRTEIDDRLRERDFSLRIGKPIDMGQIFEAKTAIVDLMAEKGFLDATVESDVRKLTETTRAVHFYITPGGKTRIREIDFVGNELYKDRKLRGQLRLTQQRKWYWPWSAKNLYHPAKWDQDVSAVRDLYLNQGYLDVEIRTPVIEMRSSDDKKKKGKKEDEAAEAEPPPPAPAEVRQPPAEEPGLSPEEEAALTPKQREQLEKKRKKQEKKQRKKAQKESKVKRWVHLTVPVVEGEQYTLGTVTTTGNEVFPDELLRALIRIPEGEVLRNNYLEAAIEQITRLYEDRGHLYATVIRQIDRREDERIADVSIAIEEDEPYYVSTIEFHGNTNTRDQVLRRELLLSEGDLFNRTRLDYSKIKVNQLGYFQVPDEPVIEPIEGENRVKVSIGGEEAGRNEIQVGGGYSGVDGAFFNGVYSTRNFLGRGQTLSVALQVGGRSNRYQLSFQEPYFLGRPIRAGFSLFRTESDYGASLRSTATGGGVLLGKRIGRNSNINLGYNYQNVTSTTVLTSAGGATGDFSQSITSSNRVSSITPAFSYNTINNPYRPTAGSLFSLSFQIAGGPLGGDTSFLKPVANYVTYKRGPARGFFGFHIQAGLIRAWADGSTLVGGSNVEGVPRFERFWLGGDTIGPRVFETRSITPLRYVVLGPSGEILDVVGDPRYIPADQLVNSVGIPVPIEVGGDRYYLFQSEYVFPFNEQAELALFFDIGNTLFEDQNFGFDSARASGGVELRFHLPIFPVPLRLIYGWPIRSLPGDRTSNFTFSIGRSF